MSDASQTRGGGDGRRFDMPGDDIVQPFQIEDLGIRGRLVRLGPLVDEVLKRHDYPEPVSRLLGEALALTVMLGSALKFEGRFILQTQSKGPISMLVADYESHGDGTGKVRGYAHMDSDAVNEAIAAGRASSAELMGEGHMALTIDQGGDMDRYQGIVELDPEGLTHSAHEYFESSEQVATRIRIAAGPLYSRDEQGHGEKHWRAGAIMIQHVAREGGLTGYREGDDDSPYTEEEESWNRASILLDTVEDHELLDPALEPQRLLFRLFHEDGVRAFQTSGVEFGCRCSRERMSSVLRSFGAEEIDSMVLDDVITTKCEFCSSVYVFTADELKEGLEE